MEKNKLSLFQKVMIGVIIAAIIGVVSVVAVKKVRVNNTKKNIAESIEYIENNFSPLDSILTLYVDSGVVEIINKARYSTLEACNCLKAMNTENDYRKLIKEETPELGDYGTNVDKNFIVAVNIYRDRELDYMYQENIQRVLMQYLSLDDHITTTIIPWPLLSLNDYKEKKRTRDEKSSQLFLESYNIMVKGAKEGEPSEKSIKKALKVRKKRDNDIDILHFDESVLDFIIRYDSLLTDYCQQQSRQQIAN